MCCAVDPVAPYEGRQRRPALPPGLDHHPRIRFTPGRTGGNSEHRRLSPAHHRTLLSSPQPCRSVGSRSSVLNEIWGERTVTHDNETIVHLIAKTTTAKGLKVTCRLDRRKYPTGRKVSDDEMKPITCISFPQRPDSQAGQRSRSPETV